MSFKCKVFKVEVRMQSQKMIQVRKCKVELIQLETKQVNWSVVMVDTCETKPSADKSASHVRVGGASRVGLKLWMCLDRVWFEILFEVNYKNSS